MAQNARMPPNPNGASRLPPRPRLEKGKLHCAAPSLCGEGVLALSTVKVLRQCCNFRCGVDVLDW